jgi:hypothetical protein
MNEQIKELAQEVGISFAGHPMNSLNVYPSELQKFAELIVRECDRYVAEHYDEMEPWMEPGDLLKHFGVEE